MDTHFDSTKGRHAHPVWPVQLRPLQVAIFTLLLALAALGARAAVQPGVVVAWGRYDNGITNVPVELTNIVQIAQGGDHGLALREDGTVATWGPNATGAMSVPSGLTDVASIAAAGGINFAVKRNGTVIWWGQYAANVTSNAPAGLTNVASITAGNAATYALHLDGQVTAWGTPTTDPALLRIPLAPDGYKSIAGGGRSTIGLSRSGKVYAWGSDETNFMTGKLVGLTNVPAGLEQGVVAISSSGSTHLALTSAGNLVPWGYSFYRIPAIPLSLTGVKGMVSTYLIEGAITSSNTVVIWGINQDNTPWWLKGVTALTAAGNVYMAISLAPVLRSEPAPLTMPGNQDASFSVIATSSTPLRYQWKHQGTDMIGETNSVLRLSKVTVFDGGDYTVLVSNDAGYSTPVQTHLTVTAAPVFTLQPLSQSVAAGDDATFTAALFNDGEAASLTWKRTGNSAIAATGPTLRLPGIQDASAGSFYAIASNRFGASTSVLATLTVIPAKPTFITEPAPQSFKAGSTLVLGASARGTLPISYQWYFNGSALDNATNSLLAITNVQVPIEGGYSVLASNRVGISMSSTAQILITASAPLFTIQPIGKSLAAGNELVLSSLAVGSYPIAYQWRHQGTNLPGANQPGLTFPNIQGANAGGYSVVASNAFGIVETAMAQINVLSSPPEITMNPTNGSVRLGENFLFAVGAKGSMPFSYQWQLNQTNLTGATNLTLLVTNASSTNMGSYRATVANSYGSATSIAAVLTGLFPPTIQTQPLNQITTEKTGGAIFSVTASGGTNLSYQWLFKGVALANATRTTYAISSPKPTDSGAYQVVVANEYGGTPSSIASLLVMPGLPVITKQPGDASAGPGDRFEFQVTATSSLPLHYQWRLGGSAIVGATNSNYVIETNAAFSNGGFYSVEVSNNAGAVISREAYLFVFGRPPIYLRMPYNQKVFPGSTVSLSADMGGRPISFTWYLDGVAIPNATNATLTITNVQPTDAGHYTVRARPAGNPWDMSAYLTVYQPGKLIGWDSNDQGQLGFPAAIDNVVEVSANGLNSLALTKDKRVIAWGPNPNGTLTPPPNLENVIAIAAGPTHSLALREDGTVAAWGNSSAQGELSVPAGLSNVVAIAAALHRSLALKSDGTMVAWGNIVIPNDTNQFLTNITMIALSDSTGIAVRQDGKVATWEGSTLTKSTFEYNRQIFLAASSTLRLSINDGDSDQLRASGPVGPGGNGDTRGSVSGAAGLQHVIALHPDGTLATLGVGGGTNTVPMPTNIVTANAVAAGSAHSLAVILSLLITQHPTNLTMEPGTNAIFTVSANSPGPIRYQWQKNSADILNATNSSLVLSNASYLDNGNYRAVVSAKRSSSISRSAALKVNAPPTISNASTSTDLPAGSDFNLTAQVTGFAPLVYQWFKDGAPIPAATNRAYELLNVQNPDSGSYLLRVTNVYGAAQTAPIKVKVSASAPRISLTLLQTNLPAGSRLMLGAKTAGSLPISLRWAHGSITLTNSDQATLVLKNLQAADVGSYFIIASNAFGTNQAEVAQIQLTESPALIVQQPQSMSVTGGSAATLTANVIGSAPLFYQWSKDGKALPGATNASYSITNATQADIAKYTFVVSNTLGSAQSQIAYLYVRPQRLAGYPIAWGDNSHVQTNVPVNLNRAIALAGGNDFSAALTEDGQVVTWGQSVLPYTNDLSRVVAITAGSTHLVGLGEDGSLRGIGSGAFGQLSPPAELTNCVQIAAGAFHTLGLSIEGKVFGWGNNLYGQAVPPTNLPEAILVSGGLFHSLALTRDHTITGWGDNTFGQLDIPAGLSNVVGIASGHYHNLALTADGRVTSWGNGFTRLPAGLNGVQAVSAGYSSSLALLSNGTVVAWSRDGTVIPTPSDAQLAVGIASGTGHSLALIRRPLIRSNPLAQTVGVLGNVNLAVAASGLNPLAYQWFLNGAIVENATNNSLVFTNARFRDAGNYTVVASNPYASVTSTVATLTVTGKPIVSILSPSSQIAATASTITLVGSAESGTPLRYQWRFNGSALLNATNSSLILTNLQSTNSGNYTLSAINLFATTESSPATLVVLEPAGILQQPLSQSVALGGAAAFTVVPSGTPPFIYQWYRNQSLIPNVSGATLTVTNVQPADVGEYYVLVINGAKATPSSIVTLSIRGGSRITSGQMLTGGLFHLSFDDLAPGTYQIDSSPDLTHWKKVTVVVLSQPHFDYIDLNSVGEPKLFYRLLRLP